MRKDEIQKIISEGFAALNVSVEEVQDMTRAVRESSTIDEAKKAFDRFKHRVKDRYRKRALECHPDRGGNEEDFKEFGQLMNALESISIWPVRRYRTGSIQVVRMHDVEPCDKKPTPSNY